MLNPVILVRFKNIVLSTPCLTSLAQINATYKLTWQGYPIIIVGTSDKQQVFHPFTLAVTPGESEEDFSFIFDALHARHSLNGSLWPYWLMVAKRSPMPL